MNTSIKLIKTDSKDISNVIKVHKGRVVCDMRLYFCDPSVGAALGTPLASAVCLWLFVQERLIGSQ